MTALARELLAQCEAYHAALDTMFAMMIVKTADEEPHCFFPNESGEPWKAAKRGYALIQRARMELEWEEPRGAPP
jgi:hypothetical protein